MDSKDTNVSLKYNSRLVENPAGNYFENIPDDLRNFLGKVGGCTQSMVENLHPNQVYEIEIKIKTKKQL